MKIAAAGPDLGGAVQFENWRWPGVALRGDSALELAGLLESVAREADAKVDRLERTVTDGEAARNRDLLIARSRAYTARRYAEALNACFIAPAED